MSFVVNYSIIDYDDRDMIDYREQCGSISSVVEFVEKLKSKHKPRGRTFLTIDSICAYDHNGELVRKELPYGLLKAFLESKPTSYFDEELNCFKATQKTELDSFLQKQQEEYSKKVSSLIQHLEFLKENY